MSKNENEHEYYWSPEVVSFVESLGINPRNIDFRGELVLKSNWDKVWIEFPTVWDYLDLTDEQKTVFKRLAGWNEEGDK